MRSTVWGVTLDDTGLSRSEYEHDVRSDLATVRIVAGRDPDASVPTCPDWSVAHLVLHLGAVYAHKAAGVRLGREPAEGEWSIGPQGQQELLAWLDEQAETMYESVYSGSPETAAHTWWAPDQTLGFWQRRMAHETAVHRVDAQLAVGAAAPIREPLAIDGCDEVLEWLGFSWRRPQDEATGQVIRLAAGGHAWLVRLATPTTVEVRGGSGVDAAADATVTGDPQELLMWLWGRPTTSVVVQGDPVAVGLMRARLSAATG